MWQVIHDFFDGLFDLPAGGWIIIGILMLLVFVMILNTMGRDKLGR
jgi:hypothetical protein